MNDTLSQMELSEETIAKLDEHLVWPADEPGGCAVIMQGAQPVYERYSGLASLEHGIPVSPLSRFHICSISKTFAGAAAAHLYQQQALDLDAQVQTYVPELPGRHRVTVRQLLNMTAGLRDSMEAMKMRGTWNRYPHAEQDLLDLLYAQEAPNFPPGERWCYTNIQFNLAALIIERVSGMSYGDYLGTTFFEPLGMTQTHLREDSSVPVPNLAEPYSPLANGWHRGVRSFGYSAPGGLVSTSGDLMKWARMFRQGGLDGSPFVEHMKQPAQLKNGTVTNYGLGIIFRRFGALSMEGHSGGLPGYKTLFARVPELDLSLILLCNRNDADIYRIVREVSKGLLGIEPDGHAANDSGVGTVSPGRYVDRESGEVLTISRQDSSGTITARKLDTQLSFQPSAEGAWLDNTGAAQSILQYGTGRDTLCSLRLDHFGQAGVYEPVPPLDQGALDYAEYLGSYRNEIMRSEAEVLIRGDELLLRFGPAFRRNAELPMSAVVPDIFETGYWRPWTNTTFAIRFEREDGQVTKMIASCELLKDVEFMRVAD